MLASPLLRIALETASGVGPLVAGAARVNRDERVIYGVKIAGFHSQNVGRTIGLSEQEFGSAANQPYSYAPEAFARALSMYEGARVYTNHPRFQYDAKTGQRAPVLEDRKDDELLGWLSDCYVGDDGVYGNLHYLAAHRSAEMLCEVAERNPGLLALSHEAYFDKPKVVNGRAVLTEITRVNAVALVAGVPGTTNSLFETAAVGNAIMTTTVKKKIRTIFEGLPASPVAKRLFEMMGPGQPMEPMAASEVEVPAATADAPSKPEDEVKTAFKAMINAVIDSAKTPEEAKEKILGLLDAQQAATDAMKGGGAKGAEGGKPADESLAPVLPAIPAAKGLDAKLILESATLLTEAKRSAPSVVLEAMAGLPDTAARRAFVAALPPEVTAAPTLPTIPRSTSPTPGAAPAPVSESAVNTVPALATDLYKEPGSLAAALRGGSR